MGKLYSLTEEHRAELAPWAEKWIANAMSTKPMDEEERDICRKAVQEMYRSANLEPPPLHRIVFVPSPLVGAFASGFAAGIWKTRVATYAATDAATAAATNVATYDATDAATDAATAAATAAATDVATRVATYVATDAATRAATYNATRVATYVATHAATNAVTDDATDAATRDATDENRWFTYQGNMPQLASLFGDAQFLLSCAASSWRMRSGGNQWSGWAAFVSFFRHIVKLPIDYSKWDAWEKLAIHSGPRYVHEKFCIISDRPEVLLVDDFNRPHCEDGPFCRWRDGFSLFSIHGVRVPAWVVLHPERITPTLIFEEENAEVRRIMMERYGVERLLDRASQIDFDFQIVDAKKNIRIPRGLYQFPDGSRWLFVTDGSTERCYTLAAPPTAQTCREAHEAITGYDESTCLVRS